MNVRPLLYVALGLSSFACVDVTTRANLDHCTFNEGDRYCAEMFADRPYCTQGQNECSSGERYGCVAEVMPECHRPCGALDEDECVTGASSTGTETDVSTGGESSSGSDGGSDSSTTGPAPCVSNEGCPDPLAPFCEEASGECVRCDQADDPDGACAELDPAAPLCVDGTCVQCTPENPATCIGETPVCDGTTNTCVPCTAHDQCGEAACNLFTGACLPTDAVMRVGPGQPFATIAAALATVPARGEGTLVVHAGPPDYNEAVTVGGGRTIGFLAADIGAGAEPPRWVRTSGAEPQLTVGAGSTVLLDGLALTGNLSAVVPGLRINGGQAWVDRSRVVQNTGGGIVAENNAELVLRNCFVGGGTEAIGVEVIDSTASVLYTTVTANTFMQTPAFGCTTPIAVDIRNSIVVSQGGASPDELACAAAVVEQSATEATVGAFNIGWFPNYNAGDFSLSASGAATFADIAEWTTGDPPTDIEGDPRPAVDGSPDHAGADVP